MSPQDWSLWWSPASSAPQLWRKAVWHCLASAGERRRQKETESWGGRERKKAAARIMKKGKGKSKAEREVMSWLGSRPNRSTVLAFHPLGVEASGNPRAAPHFQARRYVHKQPIFRWREVHHYVFGSVENRFRKTQDCKKPVAAALEVEWRLKISLKKNVK